LRTILIIGLLLLPAKVWSQSGKSEISDSFSNYNIKGKTAIQLINEANKKALSDPVSSNKLATEALERSFKSGDKLAEYRSYQTLGTLYYNSANYTAAIKYFELSSAGFGELKDKSNQAYCDKYLLLSRKKLNDLNAYEKSSKISKSKEYKTKSLSKYSKNASGSDQIDIYSELGNYYLENKDTTQALGFINRAAEATFRASDSVVLDKATSLSTFYNATGNYSENIRFQNNVLEEGKKRGKLNIVNLASYNLGSTYVATQQPEQAIPFLKQSISLSNKSQNIELKQKSVKELAKAYEDMGQYDKALTVIKDYVHTLDSLQSLHDKNLDASISLNHEFAKQEARIQKLISSQKQKEADIKRQRTILWSLAAALGLFGLLTWLLIRSIRQKQKANMQIKLQSLRAQMNPHFIFNSLNSVNNFISKNDERSANRYLSDFSKLMRTVLKNSDQDFISLETEIQTLRIYLDLEHFRFGEKFDYTLELADDMDAALVQVPPMLIQPYIENAIWHGLRYKENKGRLEIRFYTENDKLFCTVKDNGIGREKSAALKTENQKTYQSTGIKNTKERIELLNKLHGTKLHIAIYDLTENGLPSGTMAKISIPYIMQLEEV